MDDQGALVLITEYETMSSVERFWFASPNLRMRTSTVKRFGGFSTASFCTESRIDSGQDVSDSADSASQPADSGAGTKEFYSVLGW
jgi:hypothetical protein